jgi:hypothetical protein
MSLYPAAKWVRKTLNPIFQHHKRIFLKTHREIFAMKDQLGGPFYTSLTSLLRKQINENVNYKRRSRFEKKYSRHEKKYKPDWAYCPESQAKTKTEENLKRKSDI